MVGMGVGTFFVGLVGCVRAKKSNHCRFAVLHSYGVCRFYIFFAEIALIARFFQGLGAASDCITGHYSRFIFGPKNGAAYLIGDGHFFSDPRFCPFGRGTNYGRVRMAWDFSPAFVLFGIVLLTWFSARLGETLPPENGGSFNEAKFCRLCGKCMPTDKSVWPFLRNRYPM